VAFQFAILYKSFLVWILIIFAEIIHGIARVALLQPYVGDFRARQFAVFTGSIMILAISFTTIKWIGPTTKRQLISIGILWLTLTLLFEITFGLAMGMPWERIVSDYKIWKGGLLPIGLTVLTLSPLITAHLRRIKIN
jgi:hypothetical protein